MRNVVVLMLCLLLSILVYNSNGEIFNSPALFQVTSSPLEHGECPTWDNRTNNLYFVDIHKGRLYSYEYSTQNLSYIVLNGTLAPVIPSKNDTNSFIVGLNDSLANILWNRANNQVHIEIIASLQGQNTSFQVRTNEGKADRDGRVFIGTMGILGESDTPNQGSLFKIDTDNPQSPQAVISPVNISNGLAWNRENNKMFYIDSPTRQIFQFDYCNGSISNQKVVFDLKAYNLDAYPDGMTIDHDDNLWVALYGGGSVVKINPTQKTLEQTIAIPAKHVTSVAWGGPNLDILFVTTSRYSLSAEEVKQQPGAGHVFALIGLQAKGLPAYHADII